MKKILAKIFGEKEQTGKLDFPKACPQYQSPDLYKIVLLGDAQTGKSEFVTSITQEQYTKPGKRQALRISLFPSCFPFSLKSMIAEYEGNDYMPTIGLDFGIKWFGNAKLQFFDTGGNKRFRTITSTYLRRNHLRLIMFDTSSIQSFENLDSWINFVNQDQTSEVPIVIIGTKTDKARQVTTKQATEFCQSRGFKYFETCQDVSKNVLIIKQMVLLMKLHCELEASREKSA